MDNDEKTWEEEERQAQAAERAFLNAVNNLSEAVLDAIERENSEHQEAVTEAIEEALSDTNRRTMNAEEAREWNQQIFDRTIEEALETPRF